MATASTPVSAGWRLGLALVLGHAAVGRAQGVVHVRPLVGVAQVYDSNLFSTSTDRQADFVTRVTPGVESDYRSPQMTLLARYTRDLERFANHAELTGMDAREQATVESTYHSTRRLALAAGAELSRTHTPGELNGETGLILTRAAARRVAAHSSITRRFGRVAAGILDYAFAADHVAGGIGTVNHAVAIATEDRVSPRNTITTGYRVNRFLFTAEERDGVRTSQEATSQTLTVGWTHTLTRRVHLSIIAGPQVTGRSPGVELSAAVQYRLKPLDVALSYARTQTTIIGLAGTAETQRMTASTAWRFPRQALTVEVAPAFYQTAHAMMRQTVYRLPMTVGRSVRNGLSVELTVDASVQSGAGTRLTPLTHDTLARQAVTIRVVTMPVVRR